MSGDSCGVLCLGLPVPAWGPAFPAGFCLADVSGIRPLVSLLNVCPAWCLATGWLRSGRKKSRAAPRSCERAFVFSRLPASRAAAAASALTPFSWWWQTWRDASNPRVPCSGWFSSCPSEPEVRCRTHTRKPFLEAYFYEPAAGTRPSLAMAAKDPRRPPGVKPGPKTA